MGLLQGGNERQGKARNGPRRDGVAVMLGPWAAVGCGKGSMRNSHRACLDQRAGQEPERRRKHRKSHHTEKALDGVPCGLQGAVNPPEERAQFCECVFSWTRMHGSPSIPKLRATLASEPRHSDDRGLQLGYA